MIPLSRATEGTGPMKSSNSFKSNVLNPAGIILKDEGESKVSTFILSG